MADSPPACDPEMSLISSRTGPLSSGRGMHSTRIDASCALTYRSQSSSAAAGCGPVEQAHLRGDVPLPVPEPRALERGGPLAQGPHPARAEPLQPPGDPHVVLELTDGRAADGRAVDR